MRLSHALIVLLSFGLFVAVVAEDTPKGDDTKDRIEERFAALRGKMVKQQLRARGIKKKPVLEAMGRVLRHRLTPERYRSEAYDDTPLPIGFGQTISQPYIVALMTQFLQLEPDHRVLEVGTGSGYQAAVLAEIVKEVYSIEIYRELHERTKKNLQDLGYANIALRHGDGALGWKEHGPFDGIIVTCAASHIPPRLIEQLKPGGRMCIPVGSRFGSQRLILVKKDNEEKVTTRTLTGVQFVPLLTPKELTSDQGPAKKKKPEKRDQEQ